MRPGNLLVLIFLGLFLLGLGVSNSGNALAISTPSYSCIWKYYPEGGSGIYAVVRGKCEVKNPASCTAGWKIGSACDEISDKVVPKDPANSCREEFIKKPWACDNIDEARALQKECEGITAAACKVANPKFECNWVTTGVGTDARSSCQPDPKKSCDPGFVISRSCGKFTDKDACEDTKGENYPAKNCVPPAEKTTTEKGDSKETPLDSGEKETITLYQHSEKGGSQITLSEDVPNLKDRSFNDKTSSIDVSGGTWEVCTKDNYEGECTLVSGYVADVKKELGGKYNDEISSVRNKGKSAETLLDKDGKSGEGVLGGEFQIRNPLQYDTIPDILNAIAGFLYALALAVVTIMVLIGAFQILTATGSPTQIDAGKRTLLWAVIGTVVILVAGGIADLTADILGGKTRSSPGSEIAGTAGCQWRQITERTGECKPDLNCKSRYTAPSTLNCRADTQAECGAIPVKNCVEK